MCPDTPPRTAHTVAASRARVQHAPDACAPTSHHTLLAAQSDDALDRIEDMRNIPRKLVYSADPRPGPPSRTPMNDGPPTVGSIHRGTVHTIRPFGLFVAIEGFRKHVLVHHSQVHSTQLLEMSCEQCMHVVRQGAALRMVRACTIPAAGCHVDTSTAQV